MHVSTHGSIRHCIRHIITLWSTTPLLLLSTLRMTRRISSVKWDEHSWRILEVEYKDETRYTWLLLIDAEMHLQKHIKCVISNIHGSGGDGKKKEVPFLSGQCHQESMQVVPP